MKKRIPFFFAVLLLTGCVSASPAPTATPTPSVSPADAPAYRKITMAEAVKMMEEESGYIILDVRTVEEYAEKHIPGAINIPNETISSEEIPELPDKAQLILVYCRSGNRSKKASEKLVKLGYTNIVEFGGINTWPGETVSGNG